MLVQHLFVKPHLLAADVGPVVAVVRRDFNDVMIQPERVALGAQFERLFFLVAARRIKADDDKTAERVRLSGRLRHGLGLSKGARQKLDHQRLPLVWRSGSGLPSGKRASRCAAHDENIL